MRAGKRRCQRLPEVTQPGDPARPDDSTSKRMPAPVSKNPPKEGGAGEFRPRPETLPTFSMTSTSDGNGRRTCDMRQSGVALLTAVAVAIGMSATGLAQTPAAPRFGVAGMLGATIGATVRDLDKD